MSFSNRGGKTWCLVGDDSKPLDKKPTDTHGSFTQSWLQRQDFCWLGHFETRPFFSHWIVEIIPPHFDSLICMCVYAFCCFFFKKGLTGPKLMPQNHPSFRHWPWSRAAFRPRNWQSRKRRQGVCLEQLKFMLLVSGTCNFGPGEKPLASIVWDSSPTC